MKILINQQPPIINKLKYAKKTFGALQLWVNVLNKDDVGLKVNRNKFFLKRFTIS